MVLVDSSVLIDFFRGRDTPAVRRLAGFEAGSEANWALPFVCFQEILQGVDADFDAIARIRPLRVLRG